MVYACTDIGAFGVDFSSFSSPDEAVEGLDKVSKELLKYGVTSYCPTLVTSSARYYNMVSGRGCVMYPSNFHGLTAAMLDCCY